MTRSTTFSSVGELWSKILLDLNNDYGGKVKRHMPAWLFQSSEKCNDDLEVTTSQPRVTKPSVLIGFQSFFRSLVIPVIVFICNIKSHSNYIAISSATATLGGPPTSSWATSYRTLSMNMKSTLYKGYVQLIRPMLKCSLASEVGSMPCIVNCS